MNIRTFLIGFLVVLFIGGVGYKVFERQQEGSFVNWYDQTLKEEFDLSVEVNKAQKEGYSSVQNYTTADANRPLSDTLDSIDEIISATKLLQNQQTEYNRVVEENQKDVEKFVRRAKFFFSNKEYQELLQTLTDSYGERKYIRDVNSIRIDFILNLFEVLRDFEIAQDHYRKYGSSSFETIGDTYGELSSLEKYAQNDFSFKNQEAIKEKLSFEFDVLTRYREYLKSYYVVLRDLARGNYDTASYKRGKLATDSYNLAIDWDRLWRDSDAVVSNKTKSLLSSYLTQWEAVNDLGKDFSSLDLLLCRIYSTKLDLYSIVTDKESHATSSGDLLLDLSSVAPKTTDLDKLVDASIIEYAYATDSATLFTCHNRKTNESYTFSYSMN
ncbi:hypothetical protein A3A79_03065 [Candidatus Gottesmanbacteria bacterium RIFCSPLOWO2_01_FULL_43_11b]|uniref:Uncharacterized protein n=1 Tax=Candidatus Gottesmanbacteria bacterium RIFCSPLOWO2_01_FULL_43_11b TaxID=1798392 RepID=A0A1F6AHS7_9BACT|nr:MAG: hypothetical protein A3A79_03065 [Candidatus Gottesmanbacteria bacterium RIFCSPLOWO2_01_FULL_43_11b]